MNKFQHSGEPLVIARKLTPENALNIARTQPPVCASDKRAEEALKNKARSLEQRLRDTYTLILSQQPTVTVHADRISSTCTRRTEDNPILNYHPIAWQGTETHYELADLFLAPRNTMHARRITHLEMDGFTAAIPSEGGISESSIARNCARALATLRANPKSEFADAMESSICREPIGTAGITPEGLIFYPIWQIPVQESYLATLPVTITDSSATHARTLELKCTVPYEFKGGIFLDAVCGTPYYTKPSHAFFNHSNPSDPTAVFKVALASARYEGFRFLTEEEALIGAKQTWKPYDRQLKEAYSGLGGGLSGCCHALFIMSLLVAAFPAAAGIKGIEKEGLEGALPFAYFLLPAALHMIQRGLDYLVEYPVRTKGIRDTTNSLKLNPISIGLLPDPLYPKLQHSFDIRL